MSNAPGPQNGASVVIDPRDPNTLLATSQNAAFSACGIRAYVSRDSGAAWTSELLPAPEGIGFARPDGPRRRYCGIANQWEAIGPGGGEHVGYIAETTADLRSWGVFVSSRDGPTGAWSEPVRVDPANPLPGYDDKPMIVSDNSPASAHRGRLYVAWTRWIGAAANRVQLSRSDDGGRSWSVPVGVGGTGWGVQLAVTAGGAVVAAWFGGSSLWITVSSNGGATFAKPRPFASTATRFNPTGTALINAEPTEPVNPNPSLGGAPGSTWRTACRERTAGESSSPF